MVKSELRLSLVTLHQFDSGDYFVHGIIKKQQKQLFHINTLFVFQEWKASRTGMG